MQQCAHVHCNNCLSFRSHRDDLILGKQAECLLVEAMPLLNHKSAVQAKRKCQHNVLCAVQYVVDDCDEDLIGFIETKIGCHRCGFGPEPWHIPHCQEDYGKCGRKEVAKS